MAGELSTLKAAIEKFWSHVDKTETCWYWRGVRESGTYGTFTFRGETVRAHRFAWELVNGPMAKDLYACHTCDTPACVRPDHIFAGTPHDNFVDAIRKGRTVHDGKSRWTHCEKGHEFTPDNTIERPGKWRRCRTCDNAWQRQRFARLTPEQRETRWARYRELRRLKKSARLDATRKATADATEEGK